MAEQKGGPGSRGKTLAKLGAHGGILKKTPKYFLTHEWVKTKSRRKLLEGVGQCWLYRGTVKRDGEMRAEWGETWHLKVTKMGTT